MPTDEETRTETTVLYNLGFDGLLMSTPMGEGQPRNGTYWRIEQLERRVARLEDSTVTSKLAVLEERVASLAGDSKSLRRGFYTFAFSLIGGVVLLAIGLVTQL